MVQGLLGNTHNAVILNNKLCHKRKKVKNYCGKIQRNGTGEGERYRIRKREREKRKKSVGLKKERWIDK